MTGTAEYGASGAGRVPEVVSTLAAGATGAAATGAATVFALALHDPPLQVPVLQVPVLHEPVLQVLQVLHLLHVLQELGVLEWKSSDRARQRRAMIGNIGRGCVAQLQPDAEQPLEHGAGAAAHVAHVAHVGLGLALGAEQAQGFGVTTGRGWQ
jgi:hypothetical protein